MHFFTIEPETAGAAYSEDREGQPKVVFDTWLGDDVVRAYPATLVTTPVKNALLPLGAAGGFTFCRAKVASSPFFRKHNPGRKLPTFWALSIYGRPGRDDLGVTAAGVVVASQRVVDVLLRFRIGRALLAQHPPLDESTPVNPNRR